MVRKRIIVVSRESSTAANVRFHMEIALLRLVPLYTLPRLLPLDLATKTKQTTFEGPSKATKHRR